MTDEEKYIGPDSKILTTGWEQCNNRLLVPFTCKDKIGFLNATMDKVVVVPQYSMYYGECYTDEDYIIVSKISNKIAEDEQSKGVYTIVSQPLYGLINYKGEELIPVKSKKIVLFSECSYKIYKVYSDDTHYEIIDIVYNEYGSKRYYLHTIFRNKDEYLSIDPFKEGLARVCRKKNVHSLDFIWGIMNEQGAWIEDNCSFIEPFYENRNDSISLYRKGTEYRTTLGKIRKEWEERLRKSSKSSFDEEHYSLLNDGLDGEAGAYWNID